MSEQRQWFVLHVLHTRHCIEKQRMRIILNSNFMEKGSSPQSLDISHQPELTVNYLSGTLLPETDTSRVSGLEQPSKVESRR